MKESARPTDTAAPGQKAPTGVLSMYRRAFAEFHSRALWNIRECENPTAEQALAITRQLRTKGDMNARRLAEEIEEAVRAHR